MLLCFGNSVAQQVWRQEINSIDLIPACIEVPFELNSCGGSVPVGLSPELLMFVKIRVLSEETARLRFVSDSAVHVRKIERCRGSVGC